MVIFRTSSYQRRWSAAKLHKKYMHNVNLAFAGFLKNHEMKKQKSYTNLRIWKMLVLTTSSSLLQLLKSTIFFKTKSKRHGFLKLKEQSGIISSLVEYHPDKSLINQQNVTSKLPDIINFSRF